MYNKILSKIAGQIAAEQGLSSFQIEPLLEIPKNTSKGDVALPCFKLAKILSKPPVAVAEMLCETLKDSEFVTAVSSEGPFINMKLNFDKFLQPLLDGDLSTDKEPQNVLLEYSSPNIAKPFHVGHLRATLIGGSLDRIFQFSGEKVTSVNHLGDWGTQFGFVWAGCELWGKPKEESVEALVEIYRKATSLKEEQAAGKETDKPDVNLQAREYFLKLEAGDPEAVDFWKHCSEISLKYLKNTYKRLDISFDHYIGESFYAPMFEEVKADLEKVGILKNSDGALGVDLGEELGFARLTSEDGRSLYLARDVAAVKYRTNKFSPDSTLYVVGTPQTLHFKQLSAIVKQAYNVSIEHIDFGTVLGMKTRGSGTFIELNDFLSDAEKYALEAYHSQVEKRPEQANDEKVSKAVALAAIIYSTLSRGRIKDVNFRWEEALSFTGETGPYLLYAFARISSIESRANLKLEQDFKANPQLLQDASSRKVLLSLFQFERFLNLAIRDRDPMHIASYAMHLAKDFSSVYRELKILGEKEETAKARLALFSSVRSRLGDCLSLLGIPSLERM